MNSQYLLSQKFYPIYLVVGNNRYACNNVTINYTINELPSAVVVVGCGKDLYDPKKQNNNDLAPEQLLAKVLEHRSEAYSTMIECSIETKINDTEVITLLKGYIATGNLIYKTDYTTARVISLVCIHKACMLTMRPIADFMYTTTIAAIAKSTHLKKISSADAKKSSVKFYNNIPARDTISKCSKELDNIKDRDITIADIVHVLIKRIITDHSYTGNNKDIEDVKVSDYIDSDYKLNPKALSGSNNPTDNTSSVRASFTSYLYNLFLPSLKASSIFDTIKNTLINDDMCLSIVPKGADKDFKLCIEPSKAWENKPIARLTGDYVNSIRATYNPIASLATPTIYFVYFSDSARWSNSPKDYDLSGAMGVFALDPDIAERLRTKDTSANLDNNKINKLHRAMAPKWLTRCFLGNKEEAIRNSKNDMEIKMPKTKKTTNEPSKETISRVIKFDKKAAQNIADEFAKALFTHKYGSSDNARVILSPDVFYGVLSNDTTIIYLHECLGELIDLHISEDATANSPLNLRGRLTSVNISYDGGKNSNLSYEITLSNTRPLTGNEATAINNPLYEKIK